MLDGEEFWECAQKEEAKEILGLMNFIEWTPKALNDTRMLHTVKSLKPISTYQVHILSICLVAFSFRHNSTLYNV